MMKNLKNILPEKIFKVNRDLILVWVKPVVLGLVFLISFGKILMPKISEIQTILKEIKKVGTETKAVNEKTAYLLSIDQEELNSNSSLLASGILPEKNAYLLVTIIRKIATNYAFEISEFSISLGDLKKTEEAKKTNTDYEKVPVKIVLSGRRDRFLELVSGLERNLPVLSVDNFEMNSEGEVANIELTVSAYYLSETKKVNPETLGLAELTLKKEEAELLSKIKEYKPYNDGVSLNNSVEAKTYQRDDPFFTP
jgi:hypothetical protein